MKKYTAQIKLKRYIDAERYDSFTVGHSVHLEDNDDIAPMDLDFAAALGFELGEQYMFMSGLIERGLLNLRSKTDDERCYMYLFNLRGFIFELLVWFDKKDDISDMRLNVWTDNSEFEAGLDPVKVYYMGQVSFFYNS
jgi:hypothetical protein